MAMSGSSRASWRKRISIDMTQSSWPDQFRFSECDCSACASSPRGILVCSPVAKFFTVRIPERCSSSPSRTMLRASLFPISNDFLMPKRAVTQLNAETSATQIASQRQRLRVERVAQRRDESSRRACGADSACPACNVRISRSSPMAKPMPGAFGPPSISERPS